VKKKGRAVFLPAAIIIGLLVLVGGLISLMLVTSNFGTSVFQHAPNSLFSPSLSDTSHSSQRAISSTTELQATEKSTTASSSSSSSSSYSSTSSWTCVEGTCYNKESTLSFSFTVTCHPNTIYGIAPDCGSIDIFWLSSNGTGLNSPAEFYQTFYTNGTYTVASIPFSETKGEFWMAQYSFDYFAYGSDYVNVGNFTPHLKDVSGFAYNFTGGAAEPGMYTFESMNTWPSGTTTTNVTTTNSSTTTNPMPFELLYIDCYNCTWYNLNGSAFQGWYYQDGVNTSVWGPIFAQNVTLPLEYWLQGVGVQGVNANVVVLSVYYCPGGTFENCYDIFYTEGSMLNGTVP
jgi:hypothetical protein